MDGNLNSIPELFSELTSELADLVRKESELVRTEVSESLSSAAHAGEMIAIGGALLLGAFLVLLQALVLLVAKVVSPFVASLIVGIVVGVIGLVLVRSAAAKMKPSNLAPQRSARQLGKDAHMIKEQAQ